MLFKSFLKLENIRLLKLLQLFVRTWLNRPLQEIGAAIF